MFFEPINKCGYNSKIMLDIDSLWPQMHLPPPLRHTYRHVLHTDVRMISPHKWHEGHTDIFTVQQLYEKTYSHVPYTHTHTWIHIDFLSPFKVLI